MGALPAAGLLGDAVNAVQNFVIVFFSVYQAALLLHILASWIRMPYQLRPVVQFLYDVCDPYLRLFRRMLPSFGPLDLSPLVALLLLGVFERVVIYVIDQLR